MSAYEPKVMKHPSARKGKITEIKGLDATTGRPFTDYQGEPDQFPDVTAKDATTEAYYRSRGYLVPGEVPPPPAEYSEYPVMLVHPGYVAAVPDDFAIEKGDHGEIIRHKIPGSPEKFPPRQANDAAEEKAWGEKGYARSGHDDPDAIRTANASPYVPGRETAEYPKVVNGTVIDPNAPAGGPIEYPKWVGDKLVNSRAEELALTGGVLTAAPTEMCIICGEGISQSEPKGRGLHGAFHTSHMAGVVPSDGRQPLPETARERRKRGPNKPKPAAVTEAAE